MLSNVMSLVACTLYWGGGVGGVGGGNSFYEKKRGQTPSPSDPTNALPLKS